ncbi:glycoside hydrolase family protein [Bartonella sp. B17]
MTRLAMAIWCERGKSLAKALRKRKPKTSIASRYRHCGKSSALLNHNVPLTDGQFDALVSSFTYNLGGGVLQRSILCRKINYGQYEEPTRQDFNARSWQGGRGLRLD